MKILGIESSHDDTSIALIEDQQVLFFHKISQIDIHKKYGGTIPEIASREHFQNYYILLEEIKKEFDLNTIDAIAYTEKPGLIGSLQMGYLFAHALSKYLNKELIPINHLYGHIFSVLLDTNKNIEYPSIALVVSGGHTNLYLLNNSRDIQLIGQTQDDAAGEVYDKVARVLFNQFPGGPVIDQIFQDNRNKISTNIKLLNPKLEQELDFSFSGYKTQIMNLSKSDSINKTELAYTFQKQTIDFIISKVKLAIAKYQPKSIILSGGVSANSYLREQFLKLHSNALIPSLKYSTDNGAMIAIAAYIQKINNK